MKAPRPFPSDKSVARAAQVAAPTLPIHNTSAPLAVPSTASHHHPPWSPLSHSPSPRRRAVSVRSFPCRSFFNSGCTGFTLRAAATTAATTAASAPTTTAYDCCPLPSLHPKPRLLRVHCVHHDCPACNLRADRRLLLVLILDALCLDSACFVSLPPCPPPVVAVLH